MSSYRRLRRDSEEEEGPSPFPADSPGQAQSEPEAEDPLSSLHRREREVCDVGAFRPFLSLAFLAAPTLFLLASRPSCLSYPS